jgi:hypothetical protein
VQSDIIKLMRTVILYHPNSEFAGMAEDYKRDYERRYPGKNIEMVSLETVEGSEIAKLYDVVRYPAILIIGPNNGLIKLWQDRPWPPLDEVDAYNLNG